MSDLFTGLAIGDETQEEIWAREIRECQMRFQQRVQEALEFPRNQKKRKEIYQRWRKEFGDDIARESAKFAEGLITGKIRRPKWFA